MAERQVTKEGQARTLRSWMLGLHATHIIDIGGRLGYFAELRRRGGAASAQELVQKDEEKDEVMEVTVSKLVSYELEKLKGRQSRIREKLAAFEESYSLGTINASASPHVPSAAR